MLYKVSLTIAESLFENSFNNGIPWNKKLNNYQQGDVNLAIIVIYQYVLDFAS